MIKIFSYMSFFLLVLVGCSKEKISQTERDRLNSPHHNAPQSAIKIISDLSNITTFDFQKAKYFLGGRNLFVRNDHQGIIWNIDTKKIIYTNNDGSIYNIIFNKTNDHVAFKVNNILHVVNLTTMENYQLDLKKHFDKKWLQVSVLDFGKDSKSLYFYNRFKLLRWSFGTDRNPDYILKLHDSFEAHIDVDRKLCIETPFGCKKKATNIWRLDSKEYLGTINASIYTSYLSNDKKTLCYAYDEGGSKNSGIATLEDNGDLTNIVELKYPIAHSFREGTCNKKHFITSTGGRGRSFNKILVWERDGSLKNEIDFDNTLSISQNVMDKSESFFVFNSSLSEEQFYIVNIEDEGVLKRLELKEFNIIEILKEENKIYLIGEHKDSKILNLIEFDPEVWWLDQLND